MRKRSKSLSKKYKVNSGFVILNLKEHICVAFSLCYFVGFKVIQKKQEFRPKEFSAVLPSRFLCNLGKEKVKGHNYPVSQPKWIEWTRGNRKWTPANLTSKQPQWDLNFHPLDTNEFTGKTTWELAIGQKNPSPPLSLNNCVNKSLSNTWTLGSITAIALQL